MRLSMEGGGSEMKGPEGTTHCPTTTDNGRRTTCPVLLFGRVRFGGILARPFQLPKGRDGLTRQLTTKNQSNYNTHHALTHAVNHRHHSLSCYSLLYHRRALTCISLTT